MILKMFETAADGIIKGFKVALLLLFVMFLVLMMNHLDSFNGLGGVVEYVEDFNFKEDMAGAVIDGISNVTIQVYELILESTNSSMASSGLDLMFNVTGYSSFDGLVKALANTVKANI